MEIKVNNNVPNIEVTVDKSENGYEISIIEKNKLILGNQKSGSTVRIGKRDYIVLGHADETTALITKEFAKKMAFGKTGDYIESDIRKYCVGEFYNELAEAVGKENIIKHTVKLVADDGTGKDKVCQDYVSIITTENYRRYREFLEGYGASWYTATRVSYDDSLGYSRNVCCVNSNGVLDWGDCVCCSGVRPFCILNSSILVS